MRPQRWRISAPAGWNDNLTGNLIRKEVRVEATLKIIVLVEDLIFLSKIQQTAKLTGVEIESVPLQRLGERLANRSDVSAVIFDLNHRSGQAVEALRAMKSDPQNTRIPAIAFLSHVQTGLAKDAREAGCDLLIARSAFTAQLPDLLRRYSAIPA
ncbi:MAG: hypothetical protein ACRD10_12780 [Terriglobia bacterium]